MNTCTHKPTQEIYIHITRRERDSNPGLPLSRQTPLTTKPTRRFCGSEPTNTSISVQDSKQPGKRGPGPTVQVLPVGCLSDSWLQQDIVGLTASLRFDFGSYENHTNTYTNTRDAFPLFFLWSNRLVGLVVKASASRAEDPGFESRLRRDFCGVESYQ